MARVDPTRDSCVSVILKFALILGGLIALVAVVF